MQPSIAFFSDSDKLMSLSGISTYSCGCTVRRGGDPPTVHMCDTHSQLILEAYFPPERPFLALHPCPPLRRRRVSRPSPPEDLTTQGIEPNPGPGSQGPLAALVASAVKQAASGVVRTIKKQTKIPAVKKKSKSKGRANSSSSTSMSIERRMVSAPSARGIVTRQTADFSLSIPFTAVNLVLQSLNTAADAVRLYDGTSASGVQGTGAVGTVLGIGGSFTPTGGNAVMASLPLTIRGIASSFAKWRYRDLTISWVPTGASATSTTGSVVFTVVPDGNLQQNTRATTYSGVFATRNSKSTPIWQPVSLNVTQSLDGFSDDGSASWKYVDNQFSNAGTGTDVPLERQQCAGLFLVGTSGVAQATSTVFALGYFELSGTLELKDLVDVSMY